MFNAHLFNSHVKKVVWCYLFLRGVVFNWISPFMKDYMANKTSIRQITTIMKTETKMIFRDIIGFGIAITKVFGDIEEERIAEKNL